MGQNKLPATPHHLHIPGHIDQQMSHIGNDGSCSSSLFFLHLLLLTVGSAVQDEMTGCGRQSLAYQSSSSPRVAEHLLLCYPAAARGVPEELLAMAEVAAEGSSPAEGLRDKQP